MKELISSQTAADTRQITIAEDSFVTLVANGLSGAEEVTISARLDAVAVPLVKDGATVGLSASTNLIQIAGPATYDVVKPVTASPATVWIGV